MVEKLQKQSNPNPSKRITSTHLGTNYTGAASDGRWLLQEFREDPKMSQPGAVVHPPALRPKQSYGQLCWQSQMVFLKS